MKHWSKCKPLCGP